jgi:hypothetical protein
MWIIPEELGIEVAKAALGETMEDPDRHVEAGQLEIREFHDWYTPSGTFHPENTLDAWVQKEHQALEQGFSGLRAMGDGSGFLNGDREKLMAYEDSVTKIMAPSKISALCTYATEKFSRAEMKTLSGHRGVTLSNLRGKLTLFK